MQFARKIYLALLILIQLGFSQSGTFSGKITDEDTGNPVEGARVRILGTRFELRTDQNGIYKIEYEIPETIIILWKLPPRAMRIG
jgi:hypothetical protein